MITIKLSIPKDVFAATRELPTRAKRTFNREIETVVQPELQRHVKDLVVVAPGPVVHPFAFATARSRRAFFATKGFGRGVPTRRTNAIINAWTIEVTRAGEKSYIILTNTNPASQYVYGTAYQRQVPGHRATGWGRDLRPALALIQERAVELIIEAWGRAVYQAARGR